MKTYCLYVGEEEEFRGTLPDCAKHLEDSLCHANDPEYRLVVMLPRFVNYAELSEQTKIELHARMTYGSRVEFNKKLSGTTPDTN